MAEKRCTKCLCVKPLTEFAKRPERKSGYGSRCKVCHGLERDRMIKNRVVQEFIPRACVSCGIVKDADGFRKTPGCVDGYAARCISCSYLWINHKITGVQYQKMIDDAMGLCGICMEPMEVINIDHDHTCCPGRRSCGKCIRGLLCPVCNRGLGMFKDSVKSLLRAVDYLEGGDSDR